MHKILRTGLAFAAMAVLSLVAVAAPVVRALGTGFVDLVKAATVLPFLLPAQFLQGPARTRLERAAVMAWFHVTTHVYEWREWAYRTIMPFVGRMGWQLHMAFPGTVPANIAFGIVGEWAFDGPQRAQPAIIVHGTAANIVVGRWFTLAADGTARPGGAGAIGGILMNPKNYSNPGAGGVALAPNMVVPTNTVGEFGYMGAIVVPCTTAAAIGAAAWYDTTTGVIGAGAPGGGQAAIPNSKFIRYANAAPGLAVLELTN